MQIESFFGFSVRGIGNWRRVRARLGVFKRAPALVTAEGCQFQPCFVLLSDA
jgi:hypothetical protein